MLKNSAKRRTVETFPWKCPTESSLITDFTYLFFFICQIPISLLLIMHHGNLFLFFVSFYYIMPNTVVFMSCLSTSSHFICLLETSFNYDINIFTHRCSQFIECRPKTDLACMVQADKRWNTLPSKVSKSEVIFDDRNQNKMAKQKNLKTKKNYS